MARWRWLTEQTIVKHITKDLRHLGCVKCMDETSKKVLKEGWQKELAQTDHLPDRPSARWTVSPCRKNQTELSKRNEQAGFEIVKAARRNG